MRETTETGLRGPEADRATPSAAVHTTRYEVIGDPPAEAGAVNATVARPGDVNVAESPVGGVGAEVTKIAADDADGALEPTAAKALYEEALVAIVAAGVSSVQAGVFAADMAVELVNDGPVTILLDSRKGF